MAAVSPSAIRQAVSTAVANVNGLRESPWVSEGPMRDPQPALDLAYSVTVPTTEPVEARRFRGDDGVRCRTTVRVRVLVTLRQDNPIADYDDALDVEAAVCAAVATMVTTDHTAPALQRCDRQPVGDDTGVLLTSEWTVDHVVALAPGD